jgi:hypothetical protein
MDFEILINALLSLIPPALVGLIFYVVMRGIFRADSTERKVYARMEAEMREAQTKRSSDRVTKDAAAIAKPVKNTPKEPVAGTQKVSKTTKK